ncbi:hypothetical protein QR680_011716 [Steinernema hermaphroditum]|uniref:Uncharacterized protein n=1 Tax=Steinernema hermaphroditum TaxID=289476 RepID=A0AA39I1R7_9BILA|nr:hypothetical protein QR680_011716 [Steinernema hermaphroditum]
MFFFFQGIDQLTMFSFHDDLNSRDLARNIVAIRFFVEKNELDLTGGPAFREAYRLLTEGRRDHVKVAKQTVIFIRNVMKMARDLKAHQTLRSLVMGHFRAIAETSRAQKVTEVQEEVTEPPQIMPATVQYLDDLSDKIKKHQRELNSLLEAKAQVERLEKLCKEQSEEIKSLRRREVKQKLQMDDLKKSVLIAKSDWKVSRENYLKELERNQKLAEKLEKLSKSFAKLKVEKTVLEQRLSRP